MTRLRAALATVAVALVAWGVVAPGGPAAAARRGDVEHGRALFLTGCSSCHGALGGGVGGRGPALIMSGAAAAYYYLSTGRMPLASSEDTPQRKPPAYGAADISALVAYVASLGEGPPVPTVHDQSGDLALGGEEYRANCASCHSAAGVGGALSYGRAAPNLHPATPVQIAAAARSGPGQMPVFGPTVFDQHQLDSLVRYVQYLDQPEDRGGLPLGRTGPIPEGFVTWVIAVGGLLGVVAWIGTRRRSGASG